MPQFAQQQPANWAPEQRLSFGPGMTSLQLAGRENICALALLPGIIGETGSSVRANGKRIADWPRLFRNVNTVTWPEALGRNDGVDALAVASIVRAGSCRWDLSMRPVELSCILVLLTTLAGRGPCSSPSSSATSRLASHDKVPSSLVAGPARPLLSCSVGRVFSPAPRSPSTFPTSTAVLSSTASREGARRDRRQQDVGLGLRSRLKRGSLRQRLGLAAGGDVDAEVVHKVVGHVGICRSRQLCCMYACVPTRGCEARPTNRV